MGFFNLFKKMSANTISLPARNGNSFIQSYTYNLTRVTIGDKLVVDNGWSAVLVAKDMALDVFSSGEHYLNLGMIPKLTRALKLDRGRKKRKGKNILVELPKTFLCDIYFVNHKVFENRLWKSDSIRIKTTKYKNLKFWVQGRFDVQVTNPASVVNLFLIDWGFIRSDRVLGKLGFLVGEVCTEELRKIKDTNPDELKKKEFVERFIKPKIDKNFAKYGLVFTNVGIEDIAYPRGFDVEKPEEQLEYVPPVIEIDESVEQKLEIPNIKEEILHKSKKLPDLKEEEISVAVKNNNVEKRVEIEENKIKTEEKSNISTENNKKFEKDDITELFGSADIKPEIIPTGNRRRSLKLCAKCQSILPVGSRFCPQCGEPIADAPQGVLVCPKCGKSNKSGTLFCECGCYLPPKDV